MISRLWLLRVIEIWSMLLYLVCSVLVVYVCFVKQMLQLRQEESLSCGLEVCLNCFNLIGGQHFPAAVTLHMYTEYKTSFWSSWCISVCMSESVCPTTALQPSHPAHSHMTLYMKWFVHLVNMLRLMMHMKSNQWGSRGSAWGAALIT